MRTKRALAVLAATAAGSSSLLLATPAHAANLGSVVVSPATGTTSTSFGGSVNASCPAGTNDSYFNITGPSVDSGLGEGFLGQGSTTGTGPQSFSGASIANLSSTDGAYPSGTYEITFNCVNGAAITDTYKTTFVYDATAGTYSTSAVAPDPIATSVSLSASPTSAFVGDVVTLSATVSPAVGSGEVSFFDGATLLGTDTTVVSGAASYAWTTTATGARSITAQYADGSGTYSGSTSSPVTVTVSAVPAADTTSTLTVSPTSGDAYANVDQTCAVAPPVGDGRTVSGDVRFKDGATVLATVPLTAGSASYASNVFGPGAHSFTCEYLGNAAFNPSTSNAVAASYTQAGASTDFNATVSIPTGVITISTPFSPSNPLSLGTALLDAATSTYYASAALNGIYISDTRAGAPGFTAKILAGTFTNSAATSGVTSFPGSKAGLTGLAAVQVVGNAMQAGDVVLSNTAPDAPGIGAPTTFASYAAGQAAGAVTINGTFGIAGVSNSVVAGTYTSLVTLTAV